MNGAIMGMTRAEIARKFDEIVDFAGVERYIDTPVKRYSSGMTVRLGFAVAAFLEPEILVVDEVLAVGDAEFQKKAIGKMQNISHGDGRTVLFVSHNMASIQKLCKKGIVLENGTIAMNDNIEQAVNFYISATVKNKEYEYINNLKVSHKISNIYLSSDNLKVYCIDSYNKRYYLNVEFEIENPRKLQFGCTIFTLQGEPLISTQVFDKFSEALNEGRCKIKIHIPDSVLKQGEYYLEGAFWREGEELIESNECFMRIRVEARNKMEFIGSGIRGYIVNPNNWVYQNDKAI
jgi:lipopolysaccharide transport system ATP-binding protein